MYLKYWKNLNSLYFLHIMDGFYPDIYARERSIDNSMSDFIHIYSLHLHAHNWWFKWYWKKPEDNLENHTLSLLWILWVCLLKIETLKTRRQTLSLNFALRLLDCPQHQNFFRYTEKRDIFLRKQPLLHTPLAQTDRYKKSPLPYLTKLLNEYFEKKIEEHDYINIPSRYFPLVKLNNGL